ncbi:protein FAR1-RELATED SEQUENCE 2-like [Apium graveolens]|uniref:protein FAR1-RELATED SEQUENCE 2-like n=1 Tax=Apium graveolens TaxID=4045 RepID=UPI003D7B9B5D
MDNKLAYLNDSFYGDSFRSGSDVGISVVTDVSSTESESSSRNYTISPGCNIYYIPSCVVENGVPYTNQVFESVDQGFNNPKDDPKVLNKRRSVTHRCGCKAKMILNREMTTSLRNICYNSAKVNIGVSKSFSFAKEMYGGYANVGALLQDFRNFNTDLKLFIGDKDTQMMIDKFKRIQDKFKSFYYAYDVDSYGRLTKLFWADSIGRRNFELYGDAILFDATFDTNRYNLILAPFTGVDKHDRCVTFASCLLSHESVADYSWDFGHQVKAWGRNHVLIIIDQFPAITVFVRDVFSDVNGHVRSKHRLCMWHIMEKFPVKLGNRLCKETDFMEKMKTYIWSSIIETEEFERGWERVIKEFNLENNKWLQDMYALKASWIPAFFWNEPMFGLLRTTSKSESEILFFG